MLLVLPSFPPPSYVGLRISYRAMELLRTRGECCGIGRRRFVGVERTTVSLNGRGRILVRLSGTEMLISVMAGDNADEGKAVEQICDAIKVAA